MKKFAKIFGIIWMIFFGLAALVNLLKQDLSFIGTRSIGYILGFLFAQIFFISVGYFIYKWGAKK
ncbi:hypothetical protein [Belliella aquatica]|uniref:hypothetical protein n=1 Tax=Belliella aquatica TaxID=1323734 RepID=UPI001F4B3069|nr:hypothetical protein [Belliella aquatica]